MSFTGCVKKRFDIADFGESFSGFDRFPFDDIPPEFREHFPTHWNRRFSSRDEPDRTQQPPPQPHSPQQQTAATQTEHSPAQPEEPSQQTHLPQYGLRNTVDLGQKSPADPSLVDAEERNQRSMSAPPDSCPQNQSSSRMSAQNHQETHLPPHAEQPQQSSNVRHIPIFVEGRDEPVINKSVDHGTHFGDTKPSYVPPPQPHVDREQFYDDGPAFHAPPNFSRSFGTPFKGGFRQGPQPFVQQKVYPQTAFARGASPQRSQSPKPQSPQMHPEEHYVKVPVHHEPKPEPQARPQQKQPPPQQPHQQAPHPQAPHQQAPPKQQTPPPQPKPQEKQAPSSNDPITQILSIQTDVLNLMSEVENFTGTKKDKRYLFLDEMLTRNLIKLDNIETEGKENIRQARKEAIKCIQKCIAVLEAKADKGSSTSQPQDVEMNSGTTEPVTENGELEIKEAPKNEEEAEPQAEQQPNVESQDNKEGQAPETAGAVTVADTPATEAQAADTRPEESKPAESTTEEKKDPEVGKKTSPKKGGKNVKKRDKSKDNKEKDSNKEQTEKKEDAMQIDDKGDKANVQTMEVDGAASQ